MSSKIVIIGVGCASERHPHAFRRQPRTRMKDQG